MFYYFDYNLKDEFEKSMFIEHIFCLKENGLAYAPDSDSYREDILKIYPKSEVANIEEKIELLETNHNKWIIIKNN